MKKILYHFRISLMFGIVVLSSYVYQPNTTNPTRLDNAQAAQTLSNKDSTPETSEPVIDENLPDGPSDSFQFSTDLIIKAVNPGYTINQTRDVGELIELQKLTDTSEFSLAGYGIRYTNSGGNSTLLLDFSEGSFMTGETLLMRLARSPDSDRADATYMTTLAMTAGRIELIYQNQVVDQVCWGNNGEDCIAAFKSTKPTSLVRNLDTGIFEHIIDYEPSFDPLNPSLVVPPAANTPPSPDSNDNSIETTAHCYELEFSEILSYYAKDKTEQFIELYNPSDKTVILDQCSLRYKKKTYSLSGEIASDSYYAYYPSQQNPSFTFTKNPNSTNTVELIDANGTTVDTLVYNHGQKKSTSYAKFYSNNSEEIWDATYAPTPGKENAYQEFRTCPAGKAINPDTGNCVNVASNTSTTVCPEGKYLNPLTGRCKKIESSSSSPKPCAAGYERNPETNRCRKIKTANDGADYALIPNTSSSKSVFIAAGIVILIVSLGVGYIVLQFRHEIARAARKATQRIHNVRKNLISRRIRFHRKKNP